MGKKREDEGDEVRGRKEGGWREVRREGRERGKKRGEGER